jgi:predicted nucleotidyltransferase
MPQLSWRLPEKLSDRPKADRFDRFLGRLRDKRGDRVEFVVLFGSMAKGNWSLGSDYDVLVGLRGVDEQRFIDRLGEFGDIALGDAEVFPYSRPEWERMFASYHMTMLEALEHGVVLFDRGSWRDMQRQFAEWRADGTVVPIENGWRLPPVA